MRIRYKVGLVGGIPITVAAAIALIAWLLLDGAERARNGAALAAEAHRNLIETVTASDSFVRSQPAEREAEAERVAGSAARARTILVRLAGSPWDEAQADSIRQSLDRYVAATDQLQAVTTGGDKTMRELNSRTASLVMLTDRARTRQRVSNADLIQSITQGDRKLRLARDSVSAAQELRSAVLAARLDAAGAGTAGTGAALAAVRVGSALDVLDALLRRAGQGDAADTLRRSADAATRPSGAAAFDDALERLIKVNGTEERALHEELSQLLAYAVQAGETEQATQNIAIETLELERLTTGAIGGRDADAVERMHGESTVLARTMSSLPISPLIQSEMVDAMGEWRDRLSETGRGLRQQATILATMEGIAGPMTAGARAMDERLASNADRIGQTVRTLLVLGAAVGLLLGAGTAGVVARSITGPVRRLQDRMISLAANPSGTLIAEADRRDELGAMARAANVFVTQLSRRERDLRHAKDRADAALAELRDAQASLIQAEKLASLGQLVAGVSHEINTPVGVAMTTATALETEVAELKRKVETGRIGRADMARTLDRLAEGARLTAVNLHRAAELVYSFKQIATDQASGERRRIALKPWLGELVTSLGPLLRRAGHELAVDCPDGIVIDTHPGALAQIVTNLLANARDHAFPDGRAGHLSLLVRPHGTAALRIVFADDGIGIPATMRPKVFDPFYTTARSRGSTGLGLHIVFNLVTATLGGRIDLDSEPGRGTRITIEIPLVPPDPHPAPEPA